MNTPDTEVWVCKECEQYGEIRQGSVHNIKAMNCRVKPSDPVFFDTNTPDTEEVQRGKEYSQVEITEYSNGEIRANGVLVHTPDTEWEREFDGKYPCLLVNYDCDVTDEVKDFIRSRDTYWKERVKRAVKKKQKQVSGEKRLNAGLPNTQVFLDGYNHALNDTITLIERI